MNKYMKYETNLLKDLSILWGTQKSITSNNFKGGKVTSVFGYSEIDLTECKLDNKSVVIDILGIFGGSTLIVPKEWNVVVDVFSLFGGFTNKIKRTPETKVDMENTLTVKGLVLFGFGELKSIN
jgi:predicted membrane protein